MVLGRDALPQTVLDALRFLPDGRLVVPLAVNQDFTFYVNGPVSGAGGDGEATVQIPGHASVLFQGVFAREISGGTVSTGIRFGRFRNGNNQVTQAGVPASLRASVKMDTGPYGMLLTNRNDAARDAISVLLESVGVEQQQVSVTGWGTLLPEDFGRGDPV